MSAHGTTDAVTISVSNFGLVIPESSIGSIFDALVQLNPDEKDHGRAPTSIGLGLYIARQITLAHGGSIGARSTSAEGTVFTLRLPRLLSGQELGRMNG